MIRVISAEAVPLTFRLAEGYRIAGATFISAENIILKVNTSDGRTGFGCAAPAEEVTGETSADALRALRDVLIPLLRGSDAAEHRAVIERVAAAAPAQPAARAAVDIALHDLSAQRAGVPLARLLGLKRDRLPTSITLGIAGVDESIEKARRHVAAGFRILKVKIGEDWEADLRLLRTLRRALGAGVVLRADGNQGYSEDEARHFLDALEPGLIELLEQPTPAPDLAALARLSRRSAVPIMADESLLTRADAAALVAARAADLVNLKLMKSGGVAETLAIAAITAAAGVDAMLGCMDESRIGIAAALHCALAAPSVTRADLDGHLDLLDDVARGGVRIENGYILPSLDEAGLGVSVDL
ncbi:MAG TPA: enolase C-terminal domain-like protein [Candidatus Polarisedimenticolia bacterium]|nr:enolase C-terminal domain-like protein [Candidatus Polarisedimenticolia bacterium]